MSPGPTDRRWEELARAIAAPWPRLQNRDGTFPDYVFGGEPGFRARYGEAMLGAGLVLHGLRTDDDRTTAAGLRGVGYAVGRSDLQRDRPSVFENLAVASTYLLARGRLADHRDFRPHRAEWEHWLRKVRLLRVDATERFVNKQVVEAAGTIAVLRTALRSSDPRAVLGGQRATARRLAFGLVNRRVPALAAAQAVDVESEPAAVLSDPPSNPIAYHALVAGFYARAVAQLGRRASVAAHRALASLTYASWALAGPDGDLAYVGRSQEQAWTLTCTAFAAIVAAADPRTAGKRRADLHALADRALTRLRDRHGVGDRGLWIIPALARDPSAGLRGLDGYAGATVYNGLTLVMLEWGLRARAGGQPGGELAADRPGVRRLSRREGQLTLVRAPEAWFAVRRSTSRAVFPEDLRYDFGLVALKVSDGAAWRDLLPLRPRTTDRPDSAGPILISEGERAFPFGRRIAAGPGAAVAITGGFVTAGGRVLRSGVRFTFAARGAAVELGFPARRGDRLELSAFFRGPPAHHPGPEGGRVTDGDLELTFSLPVRMTTEGAYASGSDPRLTRARLQLRPARDERVAVVFGPAG